MLIDDLRSFARDMRGVKTESVKQLLLDAAEALEIAYAALAVPAQASGNASVAHALNEWADLGSNSLQWLKNIKDGISTADEAIAEMQSNYERVLALSRAALSPVSSTGRATTEDWPDAPGGPL